MALALVACRGSDPMEALPASTRLQFTVHPTRADTGRVIDPAVQVAVLDEGGWADTTFRDSIVVVLEQNPGGAVLSGTTVAVAERGIVRFTDLRLDQPGHGYVLRASTRSRPAAISPPFTVLAPSPPPPPVPQGTHLEFTVQPGTADTGGVISPVVQVVARDSAGTTITTFTGTVMIAIAANPSGGTLSGTLSAAASNGVARFANLRINRAGDGYTLAALADEVAVATSASFNVTAPPP